MHYAGYAAIALALVAALWGVFERLKVRRVLRTPFRRTGDIARTGDGQVSCEGAVRATDPVLSPCSGTPCLYWEIEVVQHWRKLVMGENGVKDELGKSTVLQDHGGVRFFIDDGTGPVAVDPRMGITAEKEVAFETTKPMSHGDVALGCFRAFVQPMVGNKMRGTAIEVVEKIVPIGGAMFVLGQLEEGCITQPNASRKGRQATLMQATRNMMVAAATAVGMLLPGIALLAVPTAKVPEAPLAAAFTMVPPPPTALTPIVIAPPGPPVTIDPEPPPVPPATKPPAQASRTHRKKR